MDNSTVDFTTPETATNSTTHPTALIVILELCSFSITFVFGLPTHSYVLWLIVTGAGSGITSEFFNLNLSFCEICNSVNGLIFTLTYCFFSLTSVKMFLLGLIIMGRPLFQCLICVERYLAVVHPVTFLKLKPLRYRAICCAIVWIITFGCCFVCLFTAELWEHTLFVSVHFLLILSIQLFCLVAVLVALKQSGPGDRRREGEKGNHMKRRAFYLILITTVSMTVIYGPCIVAGAVTILKGQNFYVIWCTGLICYLLPGFVEPVLYLHRAGKLILCTSMISLFS